MGIPAYFSHIIKEHRKIIKQISCKKYGNSNYLFLDSNSIIYDVIRGLTYSETDPNFEKDAILEICKQIQYYINITKPTDKTMIAFDGIAPVAILKRKIYQEGTRVEYLCHYTGNTVYEKSIV
jgi:5'-3' exonuclease